MFDRFQWFEKQKRERSYQDLVVAPLLQLEGKFRIFNYGALSLDPGRYPLYLLHSENLSPNKPTILITGGVHGYETSGVLGAIEFCKDVNEDELSQFNFICAPCLSPWAFETINRWNPQAVDPNRSFYAESPAEECWLFMRALSDLNQNVLGHFDLHETTDTDNTRFRPELALRDGVEQELWDIPDGFYLVGDSGNPQPEFMKAIIAGVKKITPIAPADGDGRLIGVPIEQEGVIYYDVQGLSLCAGVAKAPFSVTTEVYPDSSKTNPEECIRAQVQAIRSGLEFLAFI